jgi:glycosyltransferase involved in cell wall biosynthesis
MTEIVSLYIVNKNYSIYLEKSIKSALRQSYPNIDIIIIDDGSTDDSINIINKYKNLRQVRIIQNEKSIGLIKSSNLAIKAARGKYIIRLDADDIMDHKCVELLYAKIKTDSKAALVYSNYYLIDEYENIISKKKEIDIKKNKFRGPVLAACCLIRISSLFEVNLYDERYSRQDGYDLWYKIIRNFNVLYINKYLFFYRRHKHNLTNKKWEINKTRSKIIYNFTKTKLKNKKINALILCRSKEIENIDVLKKIKNKTYLEYTIEDCLKCRIIDNTILITESNKIINFTKRKYRKKLKIFKRGYEQAQINRNPKSNILHLLKDNCDILVIVQPIYFFERIHYLEQAIGKLILDNLDKVVSTISESIYTNFYMHSKNGIKLISNNNEKKLKYENNLIFRESGGIIIYNYKSYKNNKIKNIGNIVIEKDEIQTLLE